MSGSRGDVPLVGRQPELALLRAAVGAAAAGTPGAVVVAGPAGGGKTRLVRALLEDSPHQDAFVLRSQCVDLGDPGLPYLTMIDLVRGLRAMAATDGDVAAVLDRYPLAAGLADPAAEQVGAGDDLQRLQLFDAASALLAEVGRIRGPIVVVVEDLQWADASSADLLRFVLGRLIGERLLVVATIRTEGLSARPRIRRLLTDLARLPSVERLDLEPLDPAEIAEFLARLTGCQPDPEVTAEVFRRTRGNPYYTRVLSAAVARGGIGSAGDTEIPRELADLLVGRLDGLPGGALAVVRQAAAVGHPVSHRLLRESLGLTEVALDEALHVAVAEGILIPDGSGYAFAHDLLRTAVYEDLLPGERLRLHASCAGALAADSAGLTSPAELAHHFAAAEDFSQLLVWSIRAADEALRLAAPSEALQHLERALATWPQVADAADLVGRSDGRVAAQAARAAGLAGEPTRAIELAGRAIQRCDAEQDASGGVRARTELACRLIAIDATDQVIRPARDAVRLADAAHVDVDLAALAHVVLARALLSARHIDEARPQARRALEQARAASAPALEADALTTAAFLAEIDGDTDAAADRLGAALRLARRSGELAAELRAHYLLGCLHYYNGDVAGSLPVLRSAVARVDESGLRWSDSGVELRLLQATALYVSGDLAGSLASAQTAGSRPPDVAAARLAAVGCYPAVALGHPDAGRQLTALRGSWQIDPQVALVAGGCEADLLGWQGEYGAAVDIADRAQAHLDRVAGEGMYGGLWLSAVALAALADHAAACRLRRDEPGTAAARNRGEALLRRVERIVDGGHGRPGDLGPEGRAWHARARAEHARLDGHPAVELWQQALDAFGYGHAYEVARGQWRLAEALLAAGDRPAARTHALTAAASAERMGARLLQQAVAATIIGARLAGPTAGADGVLTGREREVLSLVAEGLTNRDIGKRLFISEKTASVHLSNLMAKLNVSSRTEAVTIAQRRGLLDVLGKPPV